MTDRKKAKRHKGLLGTFMLEALDVCKLAGSALLAKVIWRVLF
jgi:hypothetical protein